VEQRGCAIQQLFLINQKWEELMTTAKPFEISKLSVGEAWKSVRKNQGSHGIDFQSIEDFEVNLKDNLYKKITDTIEVASTKVTQTKNKVTKNLIMYF
jgi:hypothetical protein